MKALGTSGLRSNTDFRRFLAAETVSELGNTVGSFGLPIAVFLTTGSTLASGVVVAAAAMGSIGCSLIAGAVADRRSRRTVMVWASSGRMLTWTALAVCVTREEVHLGWLVSVAVAGGGFAALFAAAQAGAMRTIVAPGDYARAGAAIEGRNAAVDIIGAPLGGLLLGLGVGVPLAANAASFAVSALAIIGIRAPLGTPEGRRSRGFWKELAEGYRYVWSRAPYRVLTLASAASNFGINAFIFALVLALQSAHHPPWEIGLVQSGIAVSVLVGASVTGQVIHRLQICTTLRVAAVLRVAALFGITLCLDEILVVVPLLVAGFILTSTSNTAERTYMALTTRTEFQGKVASFEQFVGQAFVPVAPLAAGSLVGIWRPGLALAAFSCIAAVGALVLIRSTAVGGLPRVADLVVID